MAKSIRFSNNKETANTIGRMGNDLYEEVYVYFRGENNSYINPQNPTITIQKNKLPVSVRTFASKVGEGEYSLTLSGNNNYEYRFRFYPQSLQPGLYTIVFKGTDPALPDDPLVITGGFKVGSSTIEFEYVRRLRQRLMDLDPKFYQLINNRIQAWDDEHLFTYIEDALSDFNNYLPATQYTLAGVPNYSLILEGAFFYALRAMAVRETWNAIQYNDELSFTIDRFNNFNTLADKAKELFDAGVTKFKDYIALYGAGTGGALISGADADGSSASSPSAGTEGAAYWMGEVQIPLQLSSRILSWMPNSKNVFGI